MIQITDKPIDFNRVFESILTPKAGGIAHFIGTVRDDDGIEGLFYESYPGMADQKMAQVMVEAKGRWPLQKISVVHRIGWVPVGEAAVVIAVSSAHRKEAFEACRFVIDRIKEIVPIWKTSPNPLLCKEGARGIKDCCRGDPMWSPSSEGQPHRAAPTKIGI